MARLRSDAFAKEKEGKKEKKTTEESTRTRESPLRPDDTQLRHNYVSMLL